MDRYKHHFHYFSTHVNQEVKSIYWHEFLRSLAMSMMIFFVPIYLYTLGYSLVQILGFFLQVYLWYLLILPFGARFGSRYGYKHAIFFAYILIIFFWILISLLEQNPMLYYVAPVILTVYKSLFWPAYNTEMAVNADGGQRGREVGVLFSVQQLVFILGPALGGLLMEFFGFGVLFAIAAALMLASVYPLFRTPDIHAEHDFKLRNVFKIFREYKQNFFGYWGYAEENITGVIWPVYMFIVISDFLDVGAVAALATLIGTVLMLYVGKLSDRRDRREMIFTTSVYYGATWIFRFLGRTTGTVLLFDAMNRTGRDILNVPMIALTITNAAKKDADYAIAYNVFYEYSVIVGKLIIMLAGIAILAAGGSIFLVFALAGIMTLLYGLLK